MIYPNNFIAKKAPKKDIIPLDIGVDEALKIILSMGIINPDDNKTKQHKKKERKIHRHDK